MHVAMVDAGRPKDVPNILGKIMNDVSDGPETPAAGRGYQTRINRVLESYVKAQRGSEGQ